MASRRLVTKVLRYRDQTGKDVEAHARHWAGFRFRSGPVIVAAVGSWGTVQVWAESEAEGRRVVNHAAAIAGFDPDSGEWIITRSKSPRFGRTVTVEVMPSGRGPWVSKRAGPDGVPVPVAVE